jgi:hypothetical protein
MAFCIKVNLKSFLYFQNRHNIFALFLSPSARGKIGNLDGWIMSHILYHSDTRAQTIERNFKWQADVVQLLTL